MDKKLNVKNLTISFRTTNGKVQAVRDISFDLNKGETLAIVGESGSGKSVTSKAILGILAGNSIVEGGEIIYDGQDLLKISEEDFHKIRGDKIAMIFQDPMSSLDPIVRIGSQLTEAMILKGKARQKASKKEFERMLSELGKYMELSGIDKETVKTNIQKFKQFESKHILLEKAYEDAYNSASEAIPDIENARFLIEKHAFEKDARRTIVEISKKALRSVSEYLIEGEDAASVQMSVEALLGCRNDVIKSGDYSTVDTEFSKLYGCLKAALAKEKPNFFAIGYYVTFSQNPIPDMEIPELNKFMRRYLDDNFMLSFIEDAKKAVMYAAEFFYKEKQDVVDVFRETADSFDRADLSKNEIGEAVSKSIKEVMESINPLEINKDSAAYTFASGMKNAVSIYFGGKVKNKKEEKRFAKQQAKFDKIMSKGKTPDWTVAPESLVDLDLAKNNIKLIIEHLRDHYIKILSEKDSRNYDNETVAIIDWLKLNASGCVHKVTKGAAKHRAIKLMEEVGIPEPRKRYKQYPFEFSGGMRQRIVIAIALAADPDILICDEPTTALDVTIQAQILELINKIKAERNLSIIFITHDLGVVANMADRIAVMYAGKIVEYGTSGDIFYDPRHPYTWALLSSMPDLDTDDKLEAIPGTPPNMIYPPKGDAFAARNKYAMQIDFERQPPMFAASDTHYAATWLLHPDAPKVEMPKLVSDRINRMKKLGGGN